MDEPRRMFAAIRAVRREVVLSAYDRWPPELQACAFAPLEAALELSVDELVGILSWSRTYRDLRRMPRPLPLTPLLERMGEIALPCACFPKLGPCSWKERPGLAFVPPGAVNTDLVAAMLRCCTDRMAAILHAYVEESEPVQMMFFRHVDVDEGIEARLRHTSRGPQVLQASHGPRWRGVGQIEAWEPWVRRISAYIDFTRFDVDIVIRPAGLAPPVSIVDINPRMSPASWRGVGDGDA